MTHEDKRRGSETGEEKGSESCREATEEARLERGERGKTY